MSTFGPSLSSPVQKISYVSCRPEPYPYDRSSFMLQFKCNAIITSYCALTQAKAPGPPGEPIVANSRHVTSICSKQHNDYIILLIYSCN